MDILEFGPFDPAVDYRLRPGGYVVVTDAARRVAVLRGKAGVFLPGGGQEVGEASECAAVREAFEEAGFEVELAGLVGVADELVYAGGAWGHFRKRCSFFTAQLKRGAPIVDVPPSEGVIEWLPIEGAIDVLSHASQRWALARHVLARAEDATTDSVREATWRQCGATIDALDAVVIACPDAIWTSQIEEPWLWYMAYHAAFFLDYCLAEEPESFVPPAPFSLAELDPAGVLPDRIYGRSEVRAYLAYGREKARMRILDPHSDWLWRSHSYANVTGTGFEIVLYTMRHMQHHAAQIATNLRRQGVAPPRWIKHALER